MRPGFAHMGTIGLGCFGSCCRGCALRGMCGPSRPSLCVSMLLACSLPTLLRSASNGAPQLRTSRAAIVDYFDTFLRVKPQGVVNESHVQVLSPTLAAHYGIYTFKLTNADASTKTVGARFSFTYRKEGGRWLIIEHHSSAMPEATALPMMPAVDEVRGLFNSELGGPAGLVAWCGAPMHVVVAHGWVAWARAWGHMWPISPRALHVCLQRGTALWRRWTLRRWPSCTPRTRCCCPRCPTRCGGWCAGLWVGEAVCGGGGFGQPSSTRLAAHQP